MHDGACPGCPLLEHYGHEEQFTVSDKRIYSNNVQQTLEMVAGGLGWSTVSQMVAREGLAAGDFVEISIEGSPGVSWMAEVIYPSDDKLTLAGDAFLQNTLKLEGRIL